jgi:hypothetical protein
LDIADRFLPAFAVWENMVILQPLRRAAAEALSSVPLIHSVLYRLRNVPAVCRNRQSGAAQQNQYQR